jgi:gliding motility-associated-like protein
MHNNAKGGIGNDLALDDIGFTPSGPQTTVGTAGAKNDTFYNFCFNKNITLAATVGNCYTDNTFQWQSSTDNVTWANIPGANNSTYNFTVKNTGIVYYRLIVAELGNIENITCRVNSNTFTVISANPKTQSISANICFGKTYILPSGRAVNKSGLHRDTTRSTGGCDSMITNLNLTVDPPIRSTQNIGICQGLAYMRHSTAGTYIDTLINANGCDSIRTLNLSLYPKPKPNLGPDQSVCFGDTVILTPGIFSTYLWQGNTTLPYYKVSAPGTYWVKVYDANGCEGIDSVNVAMTNCRPFKPPNTFTPNNDNINDTWRINQLSIYKNCLVKIFDRYGQLVFNSKGPYVPWDGIANGKPSPTGTYYYIIDVADTGQKFSGWLLLVR